jgi:hypothetical protein
MVPLTMVFFGKKSGMPAFLRCGQLPDFPDLQKNAGIPQTI